MGVKLNSADFQKGGFVAADAAATARLLNAEAIDLVEISGGTYESPAMQGWVKDQSRRASTRKREAYFLDLARDIVAVARVPIPVTGGIRRRATAEDALAPVDGRPGVAMVGIAQALVYAPDLPNRWNRAEAVIDVPRVTWKSSLASAATMALTKLQLQRLGRGQPDFRRRGAKGVAARPVAHPQTEQKLSPLAGGPDMKRILHVVSNVAHYDDPNLPTGLWLSELSHAWDIFAARGWEQRLVSPAGGRSPLEPRALKWPLLDASAKAWLNDPAKMALLEQTARPDEIDAAEFDAIYFTGGHAVMWDFPDSPGLQRLTRDIWEAGKIVSSVCHGYCGLLNTRLSDGRLLVDGRRLTGFSWREEVLAGVARHMPYNAEAEMTARGAHYNKALLPFVSHIVTDGRLITGQNPGSAKATAKAVAQRLSAQP